MTTGMIWFDNDPQKNIYEKIQTAIRYYQIKFGGQPTICFLSPKLKDNLADTGFGIEVDYNLNLSPDHIWLGVR
ncbi:MAG TPA: hypothetical protein VK856_10785 [Anaerolineaceae bacterium]|nr:hypothetical protein [Anaerolineaceae bacterium]